MKIRILLCLLLLPLFCFSNPVESGFLQELEMVKQNPEQQFAYVPDEIKLIILELCQSMQDALSAQANDACQQLHADASIVLKNLLIHLIADLQASELSVQHRDALEKYHKDIVDGAADIRVYEVEDPTTNTRYSRVACSLIVNNFLRVCGSATVSDTLAVCGKATVGSLTVLGDAIIKGRLILDGVVIDGTSGSGGITGADNVGAGAGLIFQSETGGILHFRSLVAGTNISISTGADTVTINNTGGSGDVVGPASSTDNAIALFDGITGKLLKQSPAPVTIDGSNNMAAVNNITMTGVLNLPATNAGATAGVITLNGISFMHAAGSSSNTFLGTTAGNFATTGIGNTGIGNGSLSDDTTGNNNTAVGTGTLSTNTAGSNNVAIGARALFENQTGASNVAVGRTSLQANTIGIENTAIGNGALPSVITGNRNIALGADAGFSLTDTDSFNIVIGNTGTSGDNSTTRIGQVQTRCFVAGIFGVNTLLGDAVPVLVDSDDQLGIAISSARYKHSIKDMENITELIGKLRPVTFKYKSDTTTNPKIHYGLIAEEVAEVLPNIVVRNEAGEPETIQYQMLPIIILKALQETIKKNKELEERIIALEKKAA